MSRTLSLSICLLLALQAEDPDAQAKALLERAEELGRTAHYEEARAAYKKLATKFPDTPAGAVGARRSAPSAFLGWRDVVRHGPSKNRVDVVLMGDGYTLEHLKAFDKLADEAPAFFEHQKTFREYWNYFNFLSAELLSAEDGIDGFGRTFDTALGGRTTGTIAGHVGIDRSRVHAMLSEMPEQDELAVVFVKQGILGTAGAGVAVIGGMSAPTTIHEWGHAFAGLGDEYATQITNHVAAVTTGINVSATDDPEKVPWAHWIRAKHPGIGVYEGAAGRVRGAWKPTASGCVMEDGEFFCPVCQEAIVLRIYSLVDPIEDCTPLAPPPGIREAMLLQEEPLEFQVRTMRPATHAIEVSWWVLPEAQFPATREPTDVGTGPATGRVATGTAVAGKEKKKVQPFGDRRDRGPLPPLPERPTASSRFDADGSHTLRLSPIDMKPGRYAVVCRARDATELRDEKWPWVLKDEHGVLESERVWWVRVPERH